MNTCRKRRQGNVVNESKPFPTCANRSTLHKDVTDRQNKTKQVTLMLPAGENDATVRDKPKRKLE